MTSRFWLSLRTLLAAVGVATAWLLLACGAQAAVLTGRVVDLAGRPIAGAEVRIWQKVKDANGPNTTDELVSFGDAEMLLTDDEGKFTSPDLLPGETFTRIVAEAKGTVAGRCGWIEIPNAQATVVAPNIALKRLRAVLGEVRDRAGQPVAGAVVFNSGDGHERLETKTGRNGKFFLEGVPEGGVFLLAEKAGYRFTGRCLPPGRSNAALTLATADETVEPLTSLPPLLSAEEDLALANEVVVPWLKEWWLAANVAGTDEQKFFALAALSGIDPLRALDGVTALGIQAPGLRAISRDGFLAVAVGRSGELDADKLEDAIEPGGEPPSIAFQYAKAARHLPAGQRPRQLEWLEAAATYAERVDGDVLRAEALALIAGAFFSIGEQDRAGAILREAEALAETLPELSRAQHVYGVLALTAVEVDAPRAVEWLDKMKADHDYSRCGAELALRLLPERPVLAEEVWNRSRAAGVLPESNDLLPMTWRGVYLPDFCYRLAGIDLRRAQGVAAAAEHPALRIRGQGAIALALAEKQPEQARKLLETLVREELPRLAVDEGLHYHPWASRPTTAAWLLPIAERVAPDLCREILWRSLALRLPHPRRDQFDDTVELADLALAKMLARYDRDLARALVEPFAARAAQWTAAGGTELKSRQAIQAAALAVRFGRDLAIAAAHVDARWANQIVERMPYGRVDSKFHPIDFARQAFVWTLARHGADRWSEAHEVCAGFWQPRPQNEAPR